MRFLMLMAEEDHHTRWERSSEVERQAVFDRFVAFTAAVKERGSVVQGEALADPTTACTIGPGSAHPVREGPFAETVEQLGGFYLVDLPDLSTAVELAHLLPSTYTIEVRPVIAT